MKTICEHPDVYFTKIGMDINGSVRVELICSSCPTKWEHIVPLDDLMDAVIELDPDPNIYIDGRLIDET